MMRWRWSRPFDGRELALLGVGLLVTLLLSSSNAYYQRIVELVLIYSMVGMSLDLVSGYAGQFSLGHSGLFAVGAYAAEYGYIHLGMPFPFDLIFAIVLSAAAGILVGMPSLRLADLYLALATAAFAIIIQLAANDASGITGGASGVGGLEPSISRYAFSAWLGNRYIWVVAVCCLLTYVLLRRVVASRWGRAMITIRDAPPLAEAAGVQVRGVKLRSFIVSAGMTGLAGGLFAHLGFLSPDIFQFSLSVSFIAIVFLGGSGTLFGSVLGAIIVVGVPQEVNINPNLDLTLYGLLLIAVMIVAPRGVGGSTMLALERLRQRPILSPSLGSVRAAVGGVWPRRSQSSNGRVKVSDSSQIPEHIAAGAVAAGADASVPGELRADGLEFAFGGLKVLDGVDIQVWRGRLLGLIGPNGSGKTTLLNVLGGQLRQAAGSIHLDGVRVDELSSSERGARGLARTFQHAALSPSLTIRENVMLGAHLQGRVRLGRAMLSTSTRRSEEAALRSRADRQLERLGIAPEYWNRRPGELPYGVLRLCEVAVALAAEPRYLLLDEPAAGLVEEEIAALAGVLRDCVARGIGVVLVEHHLGMVLSLADSVVVLESGGMIMTGPPGEVADNPKVVEAYLGPGWARAAAERAS